MRHLRMLCFGLVGRALLQARLLVDILAVSTECTASDHKHRAVWLRSSQLLVILLPFPTGASGNSYRKAARGLLQRSANLDVRGLQHL